MTAVQPTAMMSGRYQRAFTIAVVFLVAVWHLAGAGGQLLHNRSAYDSFAFLTYAAFVGLTLGMCAAVWRLTHPARIVRTTSAQWFRGVEGQMLYGRF